MEKESPAEKENKSETNSSMEESTSQIFNLTEKDQAVKDDQPKKVQTRNPIKAWGQK